MSNPAVLLKIGQRIKETRIRERITQEELATASGVAKKLFIKKSSLVNM